MIGAYQQQQGSMMAGYNPALQMTAQQNPYYQQQQFGAYVAQPTAFQQYPGYGVQAQIIPNQQQQQFVTGQQNVYQFPQGQSVPQKQQSPLLPFTQQNQNQNQRQQPLINLQTLKPQHPNQKGFDDSPINQKGVVNTLLPSKLGGDLSSILADLDYTPSTQVKIVPFL